MPGCNSVVLNVGRHLTEGKSHGLKKWSAEYNVMIKYAKRYTGLGEIQTFLKQPESESTTSSDSEVLTKKRSGKQRKVAVPSDSDTEAMETSEDKNEGEERGAVLPLPDGGPEGGDEEAEGNTEEDEEDDEEEEEDDGEDDDEESSDSEQTDHDEAKVTSEEYFTDHKYKNFWHRWLVGFYEFLSRPSAGNKKDAIRLQHASQMRALLEHLEPGGDDITRLVEQEGDAVWKQWVKPMLDQKLKKPGTVISYLTSYEKFLRYITNLRYSRFSPPLHADYQELFQIVLPEIKGWRSTVDSQTQDIQNQRFLDETEGLLTSQELLTLRASKLITEGEQILKQASLGKEPTQKEFTIARDMLITVWP